MSRSTLEMLMAMVQDEPQRLKSESEKLRQKILAQTEALRTRVEAAERLSLPWREYTEERKKTDEALSFARSEYKEVLKKTESAALSGQPRLYWLAKSMFAKLRRHSLEYQVIEAKVKLAALQDARDKLWLIVKRMNLDEILPCEHIFEFETAEKLSVEHAKQMSDTFQRIRKHREEQETLTKKILEQEIKLTNAMALVVGPTAGSGTVFTAKPPVVIDSDKMLTSRLPHVGFVNRPKLLTLIDQCEYAADHAERDLQKVRDAVKYASDSAMGRRPTRTSREWLEYSRTIVCRYNEQLTETLPPP